MRIKKLAVQLLMSLYFSTALNAQSFGKMVVMDSPKNYIGQTTDKGNAKNGLGIQSRGEAIYIGDFNSNKFHGRGILYTENGIPGLPGTAVYVGGWVKGKKQGNANCYDIFGQLIYSGRFENDKPISMYPRKKERSEKTFTFTELSDGSYYLGEMSESKIDGFGLVMTDDMYWIGSHKNGMKHGVGIMIYSPSEWQQVSYKGETCTYLDSSSSAAARHQQVKAINAEVWADFSASMEDVIHSLAEIGKDNEQDSLPAQKIQVTQFNQESVNEKIDSYYIPHLLSQLESECRDIESGKSLTHFPNSKQSEENVKNAVLKEWNERIDYVIKYSNKHKTDYIPKEVYNKMVHVRSDLAKRNRELNRKYRYECSKIRLRSVYNHYSSLVSDNYFGYASNTLDEIRDMQNRMRELREEYGYSKSEWEDW